jgi:hypothetical protein
MFSCPEVCSCGMHLNVSCEEIGGIGFNKANKMATVKSILEVNRRLSLLLDFCSVKKKKFNAYDFSLSSLFLHLGK